MATIICRKCGKELFNRAGICPHCKSLTTRINGLFNLSLGQLAIAVGLGLLGLVIFHLVKNS